MGGSINVGIQTDWFLSPLKLMMTGGTLFQENTKCCFVFQFYKLNQLQKFTGSTSTFGAYWPRISSNEEAQKAIETLKLWLEAIHVLIGEIDT